MKVSKDIKKKGLVLSTLISIANMVGGLYAEWVGLAYFFLIRRLPRGS